MKQIHIEMHPDNLYEKSNPLVAGKLDIEVSNFISSDLFLVSASLQLS